MAAGERERRTDEEKGTSERHILIPKRDGYRRVEETVSRVKYEALALVTIYLYTM